MRLSWTEDYREEMGLGQSQEGWGALHELNSAYIYFHAPSLFFHSLNPFTSSQERCLSFQRVMGLI